VVGLGLARGWIRSSLDLCAGLSSLQTKVWITRVMLNEEVRYRLMRLVHARPAMSQRELARELGFSLGKLNFCLRALVERGLIKAINFKSSKNKARYLYYLTPRG